MKSSIKQQSGSALAIGLIILTSITVISVMSLEKSGIQARMIANTQNKETGFQAAQSEMFSIYEFYAFQGIGIQAFATPLDAYWEIDGERSYYRVEPDHGISPVVESTPNLNFTNDIRVSQDRVNTLAEGNSTGMFVQYSFEATTTTSISRVGREDKILSSQALGMIVLAPKGNEG